MVLGGLEKLLNQLNQTLLNFLQLMRLLKPIKNQRAKEETADKKFRVFYYFTGIIKKMGG
jgi:hypothetical protein